MQVAIHLGAHSTDEERLLKTLLQNKGKLAREGISVPGPGRYRKSVVRMAQKLRGETATPEARDAFFASILDDDTTERIILAYENFICVPGRIFENGFLYDKAAFKPMWFRNLFPDCGVEFSIGIRNPATFIPAVYNQRGQNVKDFRTFLNGVNLDHLHWADVIHSIIETNPGCKVRVWCNEDTPLLWKTIIQKVSGHSKDCDVHGGLNVIGGIMKKEGQRRLRSYLASHPPTSELQWRRILAAFLDKYALEDALEEELDAPGWSTELVAHLSENYEVDQEEIRQIPGVDFISL